MFRNPLTDPTRAVAVPIFNSPLTDPARAVEVSVPGVHV